MVRALRKNFSAVLVCGGRAYDDACHVSAVLDELYARNGPFVLIQGGASGADYLARRWREGKEGVRLRNYPAEWGMYGRKAGPIRNQRMIDEGHPELVVAFPGGTGTADMVRRAREAGIEVIQPIAVAASRNKPGETQ